MHNYNRNINDGTVPVQFCAETRFLLSGCSCSAMKSKLN